MLTWEAPENSFPQSLRRLSSLSEWGTSRDFLTLLYQEYAVNSVLAWSARWKWIRETLGKPYLLKVPQMSPKFATKWARRKLQTVSSLSLLCSQITSDKINGRLAILWSFFSLSSHSPRTHLIWANNYEPLPLDERQFVLPVWFKAEAKWPWKTVLNPSICSRGQLNEFRVVVVSSTLFESSK